MPHSHSAIMWIQSNNAPSRAELRRKADVFAINAEQTGLQLYWDYYSTINQPRPDKDKKQATE